MRTALPAFVLLACTGCTGSLLNSELPASTAYVLAPAPAATQPTRSAASNVDLSIGRPDMAPGLDTQRIAVLKGRQLDYFRAARWGGSAVEVVQTLLVDSLQDQQLFRSVTSEQARVAGDYVLDIEVRDFQAEYASENAAPIVRVSIVGRLIRIVDRQLVATVSAQAQSQASENRLGPVVAAFESAGHEVALELARQTAAAVAADADKLRTGRGTTDNAAR
jgi:cholesterol transport system auxiliary component